MYRWHRYTRKERDKCFSDTNLLADPRPFLGNFWGDSPAVAAVLPKGHDVPRVKVGSLSPTEWTCKLSIYSATSQRNYLFFRIDL